MVSLDDPRNSDASSGFLNAAHRTHNSAYPLTARLLDGSSTSVALPRLLNYASLHNYTPYYIL